MKNRLILHCNGRLRNKGWRGLVGHCHPPLGQDPQQSWSMQLKGSVASSSAATAAFQPWSHISARTGEKGGMVGRERRVFDVGGDKGGLVSSSSHSSEQQQCREHSPGAELPTFH